MADYTLGAKDTTNLVLQQGETETLVVTVRDSAGALIDLTGTSARLQIRARVSSAVVLSERTSAGGSITMGGVLGTITIVWSATDTAAFAFDSGVYDLEWVNGSVVTRLLQGSVTIDAEVTR